MSITDNATFSSPKYVLESIETTNSFQFSYTIMTVTSLSITKSHSVAYFVAGIGICVFAAVLIVIVSTF